MKKKRVEVIQRKDTNGNAWDTSQINVVQPDQSDVNNYIHSITMVALEYIIDIYMIFTFLEI